MEVTCSDEQKECNKKQKMSSLRFGLMIVVLGMGYYLVMLLRQSLVVISTYIVEDLNMDSAGLGTLGAVMLYGYAFMQIPGGILADRLGARRIISISLLLTAGSTLLFGMAQSLSQAIIARTICGIGVAVVYVPALTAIRDGCSADSFPFMTSLLFLFGNLGNICSKKPLAALVDIVGWRQAQTILAIAAFVVALVTWIVVPDKPKEDSRVLPSTQPDDNIGIKKDSPWSIVRGSQFLSLMMWFFIISGTISGSESLWDMTYLTEVQGLIRSEAVSILTWAGIVAMVTGPIVGALAKKRSSLMFALTSYLRALLFIVYAFLPANMGFGNTALWFLAKGLTMSCFPLAFAQVRKIAPAQISGTLLGISNTIAFLGGALVTQGIGVAVNDAYIIGYRSIFTKVFILFGVSAAVATTFVYFTNFRCRKSHKSDLVG